MQAPGSIAREEVFDPGGNMTDRDSDRDRNRERVRNRRRRGDRETEAFPDDTYLASRGYDSNFDRGYDTTGYYGQEYEDEMDKSRRYYQRYSAGPNAGYPEDEDELDWDQGYGRTGVDQDRYGGGPYGGPRDYGRYAGGRETGRVARYRGQPYEYEPERMRGRYDTEPYYDRGYQQRRDYDYDESRQRGRYDYDRYGRVYDTRYEGEGGGPHGIMNDWFYTNAWYIPGPYTGHGPKGYQRADERIMEDVNFRLTHHGGLDASNIVVSVDKGEVTLQGKVDNRRAKRMAEDTADSVRGVRDVHNRLKVDRHE